MPFPYSRKDEQSPNLDLSIASTVKVSILNPYKRCVNSIDS